jgi:hypothetical protein
MNNNLCTILYRVSLPSTWRQGPTRRMSSISYSRQVSFIEDNQNYLRLLKKVHRQNLSRDRTYRGRNLLGHNFRDILKTQQPIGSGSYRQTNLAKKTYWDETYRLDKIYQQTKPNGQNLLAIPTNRRTKSIGGQNLSAGQNLLARQNLSAVPDQSADKTYRWTSISAGQNLSIDKKDYKYAF